MTRDLANCAVVFEPSDPPRAGTVAFWRPDSDEQGDLTVAIPDSAGTVRTRTVPAVRLSVADALPVLLGAGGHPTVAFWRAVTEAALHLVARGRLLPGVSDGDVDAWRAGPLDAADLEHLAALAAAMPAMARAVPVSADGSGDTLPAASALLRSFVDAVADTMPRTPAAALAAGGPAFAAVEPTPVPELRRWAIETGAGVDRGVRISLRMEPTGDDLATAGFRAVVQVHDLADPSRVADARDLWASGAPGFTQESTVDTIMAVRRAARVWPPLESLLRAAVPDELVLTDEEVTELLSGAASSLAVAGVDVHWPRELTRELSTRVSLGTEPAPSDMPAFFSGGALLDVDWQVALRGSALTEAELDALADATRPVVRLREEWALVDPDLIRRARERAAKPLTAIDALSAALTGTAEVDGQQVEVAPTGWLESLRDKLSQPDDGDEVGPPDGLAATLRDYQLRGLRWLARMTSLGLGCCLADDMGLGKTITLISLHLHLSSRPGQGPTLVVCPASLLGNWEREINRFAPGVPVRRFHGPGRTLDGLTDASSAGGHAGFVLTTYGTMRLDAETLAGQGWGMLVADEAQHVKNPRSSTARALRVIPASARVALTGTPVENNLSELWAILDWTTPGLLGTLTEFRTRWATPIETDRGGAAARRLASLVRPFLLRRKKTDPGIAPELPAKTETDQPVSLTPEQAALYQAVTSELMAEIRDSDGMARRGAIVKLLTALKQVCNHPAQYLKEDTGRLAGRSGKLELLDELLETILVEGGSALVFTQYVGMARLLERHLAERGVPTLFLHGGTPVPQRESMVQRFQDNEVPVFLLSLKAAGTGLNLTRADHVVHYDRWWNPAVEAQATDRAYRIGQTRPVQVHRLITEGTVEDRIAAMLESKRELADAVLASGDAALTELSDADLANLVELRSTP
ncbi:SNF2 family DNA or RNA helicase [Herbihabitans rhizosphaerae]|uniref:SNF2 family DNA or RNA helicase n=1 Tax=Herbihabitans rhizosphaerae TaxID=1872711 RepID=A0A4Q7KCM1_9PSEU|nr:DEAD/DEAH box helicase [Herbihabitans rhizosphaerae]RZS31248.1 SNF2 family DNA or RNA helicase [Herbihabitans rhizosphaerae]